METIPEKSSNPIEVVDLTKDDNNEIAVIEHNISIMSISSSSTEQFPNLSNATVHSFNLSGFSAPNCTSTPGLQQMEKDEANDVLNLTYNIPQDINGDIVAYEQPIEAVAENVILPNNIGDIPNVQEMPNNLDMDNIMAIAENIVPLNNIGNHSELQEILDNIDMDDLMDELGSFNTSKAIDFYFDYNN